MYIFRYTHTVSSEPSSSNWHQRINFQLSCDQGAVHVPEPLWKKLRQVHPETLKLGISSLCFFPPSFIFPGSSSLRGLPWRLGWLRICLQCRRPKFDPGLGRSPGGGSGNPLQYSFLENPHGQRSLAGYSSQGHKESDTTEWLTHMHVHICQLFFLFSEACGEINHRLVRRRMKWQMRWSLVLMATISGQAVSDKGRAAEARGLPGSDLRSQQRPGLGGSPRPRPLGPGMARVHAQRSCPLDCPFGKTGIQLSSLTEGRGWTKRPCEAPLCLPRPSSPGLRPCPPSSGKVESGILGRRERGAAESTPLPKTQHPEPSLILPLIHILEMSFPYKMAHVFNFLAALCGL